MIDGAYYVGEKVALRFAQPIPKLVKVNNKQYYFECQFGVSLAFVDEAEVPEMLGFRGGCCGKQSFVISLASEAVYKHWLTGQGGR